jgi:excisionase family DNA binding protein
MEKHDDRTEFLTLQQAAKLLNLPTHRVLTMIHRKELPALKVGAIGVSLKAKSPN